MRGWFTSAMFVVCTAAVGHAQSAHNPSLEITLKQGSAPEAQTREQLQRLLKTYDVSRWIYLEWRAVQQLLGELKARQVMEFWATDHYTWVYRTVLDRPREIGAIVAKHQLMTTLDR